MGIAGGALIPQLFVHLEEVIDFQLAFLLVMVPGYLYILYYGLSGHKAGQAGRTSAIDSATAAS
jgi:fucose permease